LFNSATNQLRAISSSVSCLFSAGNQLVAQLPGKPPTPWHNRLLVDRQAEAETELGVVSNSEFDQDGPWPR
jgi:hypothetical protein